MNVEKRTHGDGVAVCCCRMSGRYAAEAAERSDRLIGPAS